MADATATQLLIDAKKAEILAVSNAITAAVASPKPTYTRSGEFGSQTVDWNTYLGELRQIQKSAVECLEMLRKDQNIENEWAVVQSPPGPGCGYGGWY